MRLVSFSHTSLALVTGNKDVTRRCGLYWQRALRPGSRFAAIDRTPRTGHGWNKIATCETVSAAAQKIDEVTDEECRREGRPDLTAEQFIRFYEEQFVCGDDWITRIEFRVIEVTATAEVIARLVADKRQFRLAEWVPR